MGQPVSTRQRAGVIPHHPRRRTELVFLSARRRAGPLGLAFCLLGASVSSVAAAELPQSGSRFHYTVINERLADAVQQFASNVGLRVNVSDAVSGRINSRLSATSARQFLDAISSDYGLDWYYDGFALYVTTNAEIVSRTMRIPAAGFPALEAALAKDGIADARFPLRPISGTTDMRVSGPPRYVSLVERTAKALTAPSAPDKTEPPTGSVVVFRGNQSQRMNFNANGKPQ